MSGSFQNGLTFFKNLIGHDGITVLCTKCCSSTSGEL